MKWEVGFSGAHYSSLWKVKEVMEQDDMATISVIATVLHDGTVVKLYMFLFFLQSDIVYNMLCYLMKCANSCV